jgi:hypothetical protein
VNINGPSWLIFLIAILVILAVVFLFTRLFDFTPEMLVPYIIDWNKGG